MIIFHPAAEGKADVVLIYQSDFYRFLVFGQSSGSLDPQVNCPDESGRSPEDRTAALQSPLEDPGADAAGPGLCSTLMGCASRPPRREEWRHAVLLIRHVLGR